MLTPVFSITQDDDALWVTVRAPYANVKDTEIEYDGHTVLFFSKPYFLRLHLPREVTDDDTGTAEYNSDEGKFVIRVPKKVKGEHFPNLDMITELLKPSSKPSAEPSVAELQGDDNDDDGSYELEQKPGNEDTAPTDEVVLKYGYGFGWHRHGVMGKLESEVGALIDIKNPDSLRIDERVFECWKFDQEHFNPDHYLTDLLEKDDGIKECMSFKLPSSIWELTDTDRDHLKDLPRRVLPKLNIVERQCAALSLIDLLFAYLYDLRTTDGEHSVESGWTIAKLSPTLSFFVKWTNAEEALVGAIRRALCYPLYRNWQLASLVVDDLKRLLSSDRTALLHCLTDMRAVLSTSGDYRYLLNDLYLTDYCLWIQSVSDEILDWLKKEVEPLEVVKTDVELDLDDWELEAKMMALKLDSKKSKEEPEREQLDSDDES